MHKVIETVYRLSSQKLLDFSKMNLPELCDHLFILSSTSQVDGSLFSKFVRSSKLCRDQGKAFLELSER